MKQEIEAKFLNVNFDDIRAKLQKLGAECAQPLRAMQRVMLRTPEMTENGNDAFVRVRDEGDKITVTYKNFKENSLSGVDEVETTVGNLQDMVTILVAGGLEQKSFQESRRETWHLGDVEIMLDEWPWLNPFIEVEGPTEQSVEETAEALGLDWNKAVLGSVVEVYRHQYPDAHDPSGLIDIPEVRFGAVLPDKFKPLKVK